MHAHHGDLGAHGKTEKHRRNTAPFSNIHTLIDADVTSVKLDTSVKVSELKLRFNCEGDARVCVRACVEGHHMCWELCDVTKYTMSMAINNYIQFTVEGTQLQGIIESSTHYWINTVCMM